MRFVPLLMRPVRIQSDWVTYRHCQQLLVLDVLPFVEISLCVAHSLPQR
jgi:hypothetical protein|tara:strand:- start:611 stop:757 length:147 start_codon:yes stop_codon:yes gene_type:complete